MSCADGSGSGGETLDAIVVFHPHNKLLICITTTSCIVKKGFESESDINDLDF